MNRIARLVLLVALAAGPSANPAAAEEEPRPFRTDANLVTALDVSDSIMRHEAWVGFDGITRAVVAPAFLEAVAQGRHGRIGFAVFTWSAGGSFQVLVPWTIIDSQGAAERVARTLSDVPRPAPDGGGDEDASGIQHVLPKPDGRTDISGAIEFGADLMGSAPHGGGRSVLNIVGNGADNVSAPPAYARQQALLAGITINGVVLRRDPALVKYFRERVIGGFGCFALDIGDPTTFADVMVTKFLRDLISERPSVAPPADWPPVANAGDARSIEDRA